MLISKTCQTCKTPHHDHYACSKCGKQVFGIAITDSNWKCCPYCGETLYPKAKWAYIKKLHKDKK